MKVIGVIFDRDLFEVKIEENFWDKYNQRWQCHRDIQRFRFGCKLVVIRKKNIFA